MARKLTLISELAGQTTRDITHDVEGWKQYLTTAARIYKYRFDEQLLIFAQRPDATACAEMETWNEKMRRWVKPGSKGIALIREDKYGKPRLEYVFDVADTRPVRGAKMPYLWEMREEHHAPVLAALEARYGETEGGNMGDRLMELAARAVREVYREHLDDLAYDVEGSLLEGLDDLNLEVRFRDTLTASVQYTLLSRCGLDPSDYLDNEDLQGITEFSTPAVLHHLGDAASTVSMGLLQEIGRTIRSFDREMIQNRQKNIEKPLENPTDIGYTKGAREFNTLKRESGERSIENGGADIHEERRLPDSRPDAGRGGRDGGNAAGQIRDAAADLPSGTPSRDVHVHAADGEAHAAPAGDRPAGAGTDRPDAGRAEEAERSDRGTESPRSDGVGAGGEQPDGNGRGSGAGGDRQRLKQNEYDTPPESDSEKLSDFLSAEPEGLLNGILRYQELKENRATIAAYFDAHPNGGERAAYLKSLYAPVYTEFDVGVTRVGFRAYEEGLYIWKGDTFLSRTSASLLSWDAVQELDAALMERGEYLAPEDAPLPVPAKEEPFQLTLFPSVEEQIEIIAQAETEERQTKGRTPVPSGAPVAEVQEAVIARALTSGGNEQHSVERIVAFFQKGPTGSAAASFMEQEYGTGGKGLSIGGREYAMWFGHEGIRIAPGRTTNVPGCTLVPWVKAGALAVRLINDGMFATQEKIDAAQENEYQELADDLWNLRSDISEEAEQQSFTFHTDQVYGYPEVRAQIAERLKTTEGREELISDLTQFNEAFHENRELLRFPRIHNPEGLLQRLMDLRKEPLQFNSTPDFAPVRASFVTQDEIDHLLTRGSNISEGKMRIYSYYMQGHDAKERASFLRHEYGDGGFGYTGYNENHDSKGISLTREDEISGYQGYDTVKLNWNRVEKRIHELIDAGRYMSQKELDYIPIYEKNILARSIYSFYYRVPLETGRPFPEINDFYSVEKVIAPLLDDPEQVERIFNHMLETFTRTPSDTYGYDSMKAALRDMAAYQRGEYSLFTPLPEETLQEERQKKQAAKQAKTARKQTVESPPGDELAAAARTLAAARKQRTKTRERTDGQLTFDFTAMSVAEPEEPLTPPEKESGTEGIIPPDLERERQQKDAARKKADKTLEQHGLVVSDELLDVTMAELGRDATNADALVRQVEETLRRDEEEAILSQYDLGYGHLGNGLTVWNRLEIENGDYKTVAHIAPDRAVKFYDNGLPELIQEQIREIAATTELTVSATQDAPVFSTPARTEPVTPGKPSVALYREALKTLVDVVRQSSFYDYLRDRDTEYDEAQNELDSELNYYLEEIAESQPDLRRAFALPMFREWMVEDILEQTYQDYITDNRDAIARHSDDPDAPEWAREAAATPAWENDSKAPEKSPAALYRETLASLIDMVRWHGGYSYLRDEDTDYSEAEKKLSRDLDSHMSGIAKKQPALHHAYTTLPMFREALIQDILKFTYSVDSITDYRDAIARFADDPDAPEWAREPVAPPVEEQPAADNSEAETAAPEGNVPPQEAEAPEATGAGAPEAQKQPDTQTGEPGLTPNIEEYLNLKAQHPDKLIGVQVGDYYLYYGKDAQEAAPALGAKLLTRDIPGLGETTVTGGTEAWQAQLKKLLEHGHSVVLARPDPENPGGPYEIVKERDIADFIPIGMELTIDGRRMKIDSIDYETGRVSLMDLDMRGWFPIFREEPVPFVRECVEEAQHKELEDEARLPEVTNADSGELDEAKGLIAEFLHSEYGDEKVDFPDLKHIGLAYTTTEDGKHEIQAEVNLVDFSVSQLVDGVCAEKREYKSLRALIDAELSGLDFDDLVRLETPPERAREEEPPAELVEIDGGTVGNAVNSTPPDTMEIDGVKLHSVVIDLTGKPAGPKAARHNYHITDDQLGAGGAKTKYAMNVAAIRTLKQIEAEGRLATPEEQGTLSKYVGWGGVADAFDPTKENWTKENAELKELLTPEEYQSAQASVLNAHYTSPAVIKAMYQAVENMGLNPGNILEPAMGVGNFFGLVPEKMEQARMYGVELDSLTGRIARQLYQKADITIAGFETTDRRDFYDLAVGNVPFGEYKVADRAYDRLGFSIHDYFLAKMTDQLRPGGIMAVVTSRYTMDKKGSEVRKHLAQKADLLGAVRLPNNAFRANAGTDVVSDILFFQKRDRAPEREPDWVQTGKTEDGLTLNAYFLQHPEMVLGEITTKSTQYGHEELTVAPIPGAELTEQLAGAITHIAPPDRELLNADSAVEEETPGRESLPADPNVRNFSFTLLNGGLYFRENSRMNPVELGKTPAERVRGMVKIRDSARRLIDLQLGGAPDSEITQEQARLNTFYDQFTKKYGLLNSLGNKQAFEQDSAYPLLCSLEILDEDGNLEHKADMFSKRTIQRPHAVTSVDTAVEALAVSIGEKACVDLGYMASLMGGSEKIPQIVDDLKGIIFKDPESGPFDIEGEGTNWHSGWQTADEYLSGNVREKLTAARAAVLQNPEFSINVERLEQVQPKDLSAAEISVRIGSSWIGPEYYKQFLFELLHTPQRLRDSKINVRYAPITGEWNVQGKSEDSRDNVRANTTFGTKRINAYTIFENSLNQRDVRIFDTVHDADGEHRVFNAKETAIAQQKQEAMAEAFKEWIFKDPERRETLCRKYNEMFNAIRPREYDGSHIRFTGMNPEIALRPHQLNAVAHMLYGRNTLLAHCVGAGKTFEMIAAAMESKRLGLCRQSLFVVPNHLTEQWGGDFLRLYPGANVLVATKRDFEPARRKRFCARIATGDYDAVIIGHSQFEKIPLSAKRQEAILNDQIAEIVDAIQDAKDNDGERYTIKQMEKTKKNLEAKLKKLAADEKKDSVVTFEELGVDRLYVDEAHGFKNLFLHTKMRNVAGIGQTDAQKSTDMFGKCRYMDEVTGGRGVTFATGTPVSNSMVELYTMMRYLQYDTLQRNGHGHFDNWAADFGEKVTAIELSPEGTGFRSKTRFARFFNLPELMSIWKESADIQTADMLKLPVPEAEYITVTTDPSEHQQAMVAELADRADDVRKGNVEPNVDNMLKITSDGRKLALDQRLQNPLLPDDPNSKVNACVKNIFDVWEESTPVKGTQLVFCDLSTPHYDGTFNVYDDIKEKLIGRGVPPEEIAYIHDANTEAQKAELFAKVRRGQVRVLIGSTQKMGAGTNVQDRIVASHDLDCPWRPADLEQRAGRTLRQGNMNPKVKMFKYVTKGTFDAYNWGLVENKQKFIGQIMTSKSPARSAEDVDATALSYAEVKALATGDERIKEKMDLDIQVAKLKMLKSNHTAQQYEMEDKAVKYYPQKIGETNLYIECLTADLPTLQAHPAKDDAFSMTVMGTVYTERKEAGEAIIAACKTMTDPDQKLDLGEYRGFPMKLSLEGTTFKVSMKQHLTYTAELSSDPSGNITRINNALEKIPENLEAHKSNLITLQAELENAKEEAARPFPKDEELKTKSARLAELNIELDMGKGGADEPARDSQEEPEAPGLKPSILKALKQFDAPPPVPSERGRGQEREAI